MEVEVEVKGAQQRVSSWIRRPTFPARRAAGCRSEARHFKSQSGPEAFVMPSLSAVEWFVLSLLLLCRTTAGQGVEGRCSVVAPVGDQHPVQGLLERFEAGPGCAARERGNKETHVVAVGTATDSPGNKVTVLLKPLSPGPSPLRGLHLLLSSRVPVSWWLEAEQLPPNLPVLVQLSLNSSVHGGHSVRSTQSVHGAQSVHGDHSLRLHVQTLHSLPFHPRALHRWALKHHGNLTSLTHAAHGNRVYVRLGEDPTLPDVCQLQSMFLSHNYMTSDLQQQEVQGCATNATADGVDPEVHVIKLHSAGSGLCGSLQVEVVVSLVPPVANSRTHRVVLVLSSSMPVNWAITGRGVRGHVTVHSSHSVSPPFPPEPHLTLSSTVTSDLSTIPDLLTWTNESGYLNVTSYTEADLANRFVIQLTGGRTDVPVAGNPPAVKPSWAEERRLRQWLNGGGGGGRAAEGGRQSFTVQCEDGRLSVSVDRHILQSLFVSVAAVTLRDPTCQARSNGSHFLLVFPVISCGTEGLLLGPSRGVQYKNMVLLWRKQTQTVPALNETQSRSRNPLGIHFSCLASVPSRSGAASSADVSVNTPRAELLPWAPGGQQGPHPGPSRRSGPVLALELSVTESYEKGHDGPCVISADHRVYVQISADGSFIDVLEVNSCVVSPLSDPKKSRFWTVISDRCSSDPSLSLDGKDEAEEEDDEDEEEEGEETEGAGKAPVSPGGGRGGTSVRMKTSSEDIRPLRFSFILRPHFNDSMQFLHCSLRLCVSEPSRGKPAKEPVKSDCQGRIPIPPLVSRAPRRQCEVRNLSRPMVVTRPISSLVPPAGPRTKRLSVSPLSSPEPEPSSSVVQAGPVMGVIFAAFVMGVSLMGGLWCIYYYTGVSSRPASPGEGHVPEPTTRVHNTWNPASLSDLSSSSV